jgi:hypothetical protein
VCTLLGLAPPAVPYLIGSVKTAVPHEVTIGPNGFTSPTDPLECQMPRSAR